MRITKCGIYYAFEVFTEFVKTNGYIYGRIGFDIWISTGLAKVCNIYMYILQNASFSPQIYAHGWCCVHLTHTSHIK